MAKLPEELRRELEAALGHPVPEELTPEGFKVLGREVSAKAPALFRPLADAVSGEAVAAAKKRPEVRTAPPPGYARFFYVRDKDGNWVPSRLRYALLGAFVAGLLFLLLYMMLPSSPLPRRSAPPPQSTPPSQTAAETPPGAQVQAAEAERVPPPPVVGAQTGEAGASPSGAAAGGGTPPPASPESALPGPDVALPPPPDYVPPPGAGTEQVAGLTVLYSRNTPASGQGEGGGATSEGAAFYVRPRPEGGDAVQHAVPSKGGTEGGEVSGGEAYLWRRQQPEGEGGGLTFFSFRENESGGETGALFLAPSRGSGQGQGSEGAGLLLEKPKGEGGGEVQIIWRREERQGNEAGGVVPPSAAERGAAGREELPAPSPQQGPTSTGAPGGGPESPAPPGP